MKILFYLAEVESIKACFIAIFLFTYFLSTIELLRTKEVIGDLFVSLTKI